ncbi:hypothetical protein ABZX30_28820 [Streptomyces sp. NPDC004542]|uniref:hypothetical protein n=1 Tax=Streptomyces sp. NPDC004542 TaxID=3154281 RepID=UPI0033B0D301
MTISLERPAAGTADQHVKPYYDIVDPCDEPHAVLDLRVRVSRDLLAAAVEDAGTGYYDGEKHPDEWTVEEVRAFAIMTIANASSLHLQQNAVLMAQMAEPDFYEPVTREYVLAIYRAVDRAFPKAD